MAAAMATTMAILNPKCFTTNPKLGTKPPKPAQLPPLQPLPKGLTAAALSGAVFSALSTASPALAVQQLAEIADADNRGLALLLPLIPAILWVLYNILQPALNQLEKMRSSKGVIIGLGLGLGLGLAAVRVPEASAAGEVAALAEAAGSDSRGQLLLFVIAPAILWVLYNILQPALNQLEKMRSQ